MFAPQVATRRAKLRASCGIRFLRWWVRKSAAAATVGWLNAQQADPGYSGGFMWTWEVFQVQYYDMPRLPGNRIEAPDTLGFSGAAAGGTGTGTATE